MDGLALAHFLQIEMWWAICKNFFGEKIFVPAVKLSTRINSSSSFCSMSSTIERSFGSLHIIGVDLQSSSFFVHLLYNKVKNFVPSE